MIDLSYVESILVSAMKERNQVAVETLRALKTRIQNEQITKGAALTEAEILALVVSEVKRRKEAAESFASAGRTESSEKELAEIEVLKQFLPEQVSEEELAAKIDAMILENNWTSTDFGAAMGKLKAHFGNTADGAMLARVLKSKLN